MRNAGAAAQFDDDFALREPTRKKAARRPAGKAKTKPSRWAAIKVNPKQLLKRSAVGLSLLVALGIVVNALELQKGRHPAPLFGTSVTIADDGLHAPAPARAALMPPASKPVQQASAAQPVLDHDAIGDAVLAAGGKAQAPKPAQAPEHAQGASVDEIGRLLQHGPTPHAQAARVAAVRQPAPITRTPTHTAPSPAHAAHSNGAERHDARTVYGVQQALVKLGFVLKPNGVFGPQTKKALELFGKERKLPLTTDLSPRVVKILAAESGLKIEHP